MTTIRRDIGSGRSSSVYPKPTSTEGENYTSNNAEEEDRRAVRPLASVFGKIYRRSGNLDE